MDSLGYRTPSRLTHWDIRPRVDGLTGISDLEEMDKLGISGPKEMDLLGISDLGSHVLTNFVFLPGSNTLGSQILIIKLSIKLCKFFIKI